MIRIAFVGLGAAVRNIHLPACRRLRGRVAVVGGCDPDTSARQRATAAGVPVVFAEVDEMIERTRPDLVAVCTPPALHRPQVEQALAAGCHVFCEKPLAPSLVDADGIAAAAVRAGRAVIVNTEFPFMRIHAAARALIGTPMFGQLRYLHAWHTMAPTAETEAGWRENLGARLGMEFGIHVFDLVRFFFDATPVRVLAHMPRPDPRIVWDVINVVGVEFADGRAASLVLDRLSRGPERYLDLRLDGDHAAIHTSLGGQLRMGVGLHTRERRPFADIRIAGGGRAVLERGTRWRTIATDGLNPFAAATARLLQRFTDALEGRGPMPRGDVADHRASLALVFASYESATRGCAVSVDQPGRPLGPS